MNIWFLRNYYAGIYKCIINVFLVARVYWLVARRCPVAVQLLMCSRWCLGCCYCVLGFVKALCYCAVDNYIMIFFCVCGC